MIFEIIKQRVVKELIQEVKSLSATDIELVGHNLVSVLNNQRMVHHGLNKDYRPAGYTVDSFAQNSSVIAEYSVERGYFENNGTSAAPSYRKIDKDLEHAFSHNQTQTLSKIYLISSQEEIPSFRSNFNKTSWYLSHGRIIEILDARELAKIIYEQSVTNSSLASFYKQFFPSLSHNLDNYEYYGKLPTQCDSHVNDIDVINSLDEHYLSGHSVCVLSGVSGSGKSEAAISYVHHKSEEYENYIWISGDDWKDNTPLASIQRTRGGSPINIEGSFNEVKTILVIDSCEKSLCERDFSVLEDGFNKGGVVLVTSQLNNPASEIYLSKPDLSLEVAYQILNESSQGVSQVCEQFVTACRFSPLILSTARKIIEEQNIPKETFYGEALRVPQGMPGLEGVSIMRKMLEKLEEGHLVALKKIANSGVHQHDINFLHDFIGLFSSISLQRLSFLSPTNVPDIFKVHDFICLAVKDTINPNDLTSAIDNYVGSRRGEMTPSVLREIHLARNELKKVHFSGSSDLGSWLTYALLQIENEEKERVYGDLWKEEITQSSSLSKVMCIVDAKEFHAYTIEDQSERQAFYESCAKEYQGLVESGVTEDVKAELLHHRAKSLRRSGQDLEALNCFRELLELRPDWHATYGQIAHLGSQYNVMQEIKTEGEKAISYLIANMIEDSSKVPLRVSLAALARLRSYNSVSNELQKNSDTVQKLANIVALSALEGLDQFYEAFVSFTSVFGYHHSRVCVDLAEGVSDMLSLSPELVDNRQWVSACESLTNVAVAAGRANKQDLSGKLSKASLQFADRLNLNAKLKSFTARAIAKAYIIGKEPEKALDAISKVEEQDTDHWILYRKSEALIEVKDADSALEHAKKAFELAKDDSRAEKRISIYHELLSKCYKLAGDDESAVREANFAIEQCQDEQYRLALIENLNSLK
ncbi:tetratricopeptide repeat protein [Vibrio parahaemolyticus]|nr:tetratricopeptide repeat protein [Vibrio parahaemolyticus]